MVHSHKVQFCNHCGGPMFFDADYKGHVCITCGQVKEIRHSHKWQYFGKFHPKTGEHFTYTCIAEQVKERWAIYRCKCGAAKAVLLEEGQPDYFIELRKVYADSLEELLLGEKEGEGHLCLHMN